VLIPTGSLPRGFIPYGGLVYVTLLFISFGDGVLVSPVLLFMQEKALEREKTPYFWGFLVTFYFGIFRFRDLSPTSFEFLCLPVLSSRP
jgi:hypothetical protein